MRAGSLRHRVTLQSRTRAAASDGELIATWSAALSNEPAEVIETSGGETLRGLQVDANATHLVRTRFRPTAIGDETHRFVWGSRTLNVINVRDIDGRRRELWWQCREAK